MAAFRQGLRKRLWSRVRTSRSNIGGRRVDHDRLPALAADLVRRQVDCDRRDRGLIARAAKAATTTFPIVFVDGADPVGEGLVSSLNRPGGNVTGVSLYTSELAAEAAGTAAASRAQGARKFAMLVNPGAFADQAGRAASRTRLQRSGVQLLTLEASSRDARSSRPLSALVSSGASALLVSADRILQYRRAQLVALAARYALPAIYLGREYAEAGGLMSYGAEPSPMRIAKSASTSTASSKARSRPICQSSSRPSSSSSSTSRPPRRSASKYRRRCSPAPTR